MSGRLRLKITKYFGSSPVEQMEASLEEAKDYLSYFFTSDGSKNVKIAVGGQIVNSHDALLTVINQGCSDQDIVDVGLFLSNEGRDSDSIWAKRNK